MRKFKDDFDRTLEKALKRDPKLKERLEKVDRAWNIAFQIVNIREKADITQKELARMVGTKQSNIARLESADYTAYTLKTLEKITKALKARLEVRIILKSDKKDNSVIAKNV